MKALQIQRTGGPEVMELVDLPIPEPGEGELRVKMEAAGLNYSDIAIRRGSYLTKIPMPLVMGREFAGTVDKLGPGVEGWQTGQRATGVLWDGGAFAEYVVVPARSASPFPEGLSAAEAVILPIQGTTAVHLVDEVTRVQSGETVLIHAAAGGVGLLAVQICRLRGANVIGTASSDEKCETLRGYGATAINYSQGDWVAEVLKATGGKGADVILESIGGEVFLRSLREALAPFGRLAVYGAASGEMAEFAQRELMPGSKTVVGYFLGDYYPHRVDRVRAAVQNLLLWAAQGKVKLVVGHTFPLAQAAEAVAVMEERRNIGKVVITG
ncbi:MAG: quinone oxidoreductase [bacterium]